MKKRYVFYSFAILSLIVLFGIQLKWVSGSVFANPITSPISVPITSPVVSPTPTPTQPPITSPVISPTPTPEFTVMFDGKHVDGNGNSMAALDPNGFVALRNTIEGYTINILSHGGPWNVANLLPGAYEFTASNLPGYNIEHLVCFGCTTNPFEKYHAGNKFTVNTGQNTLIGITFRYIPIPSPTPTPTEAPTPTVIPIPTEIPTPTPTPTPTAQNSSNSSSSNSNSNSNNNNSNNNSNPFVCNDSKPKSAPRLISAQIIGRNNALLTWTKAENPVTYYLIAFGRKSGVMEYGVPNAGGQETTNYTINGLSTGAIYYFKVRAGNNCMPGDFSNELGIQVRGGNQSILSSKTTSLTKQSNIPTVVKKFIKVNKINTPLKEKNVPSQNVFSKITNFFSSLFNR